MGKQHLVCTCCPSTKVVVSLNEKFVINQCQPFLYDLNDFLLIFPMVYGHFIVTLFRVLTVHYHHGLITLMILVGQHCYSNQ